jgi:hypothetical protein
MGIEAPAIRALFDRTKALESDLVPRAASYSSSAISRFGSATLPLEAFRTHMHDIDPVMDVPEREALIERELQRVSLPVL